MPSTKLFSIFILYILQSVWTRPYLLFANRKDIRLLKVTDNKKKATTRIIVKNLEDAAALDYFLDINIVCWTEINREAIRCADIDPKSKGKIKTDVVTTGLIKPEGLACDWLGNKLYWTDSDTKRIEVSALTGNKEDRTVLVWQDLDLPRAISVAPHDGLMFWTDWGEYPKIERCGMNGDGETRQILVDNDLVWPNGLTLDYENKRLFWLEAKLAYIASVDWNGAKRKTILVGDGKSLPQPFAISIFQDILYWTDWDTNSLHMYNETSENAEKIKIKLKGKLSPMDIRVFEPRRQPKGDTLTPCSIDNGGCSHLCLAAPYTPGYSCHCPTGIQLLNNTHCAPNNNAILLLAARDNIRKVSLDTPDFTDIVIPLVGVINSIAIDYDPVSGRVFWTDDQVQAIRSANLDGSDEINIITKEIFHPDGVAVDWVSEQLFWTDTGTDRIEVALKNGSYRRVVISEDLDEPRGIVLDPVNGWMYWSDWGKNARIERAWMDGQSRETVIDSDLVWPNGIALDIERQKLYWCDAKKDRIEMSNVDGSERISVLDKLIPHPFGFALLGEHLYWTDWQDRSIERANKINGKERMVLVSHLDDLMGVRAVLVSPNPMVTNPCAKKPCSHLCLMTPGGAICACPDGYELSTNNNNCVIPEAFLLFTRRDDIIRISLDARNHNNFIIPVKSVTEASALEFDGGRIYWSDIEQKTISRAFINGSGLDVVVEFGLDFPEGMAVDWVAGNLYWTDTGINRIEMARLDGSNRRVLLWRDVEIPKCIAVDPLAGKLYWASWGATPTIEVAALDGSERSIFVSDVGRATGLTIDYTSSNLYWAEQDQGTIFSCSLSSPSSTQTVISGSMQPYGLTVYSSWIYWTDWSLKTIERTSLHSPTTNRTIIQSGIDYVMDLTVFRESRLSGSNPCHNEHGCEALCIAKRINITKLQPTCACPSHYTLNKDKVSCSGPTSFLLFSQKNKISRLLQNPDRLDEVPDIVLPIKRARSIQAVDFDQVQRMIYWVDHGRGEEKPGMQIIRRARDTGVTDRLGVFERTDRFLPFDLVINPLTRTLYWTCANTNTINVTRLGVEDLRSIGPLLVGGADDKPRLLALHAERDLLYVTMGEVGGSHGQTDKEGHRLEVINLVNNQRSKIVDNALGEITAVTVDNTGNKVYWMDIIMARMESCDLMGSNRRVIIREGIVEPVGLAVQGQWVYWADRDQASIVRVNKETGTSRQIVLNKVSRLSSIVAVNYLPMSSLMAHPCYSSWCSHFCSASNSGPSCSCPPNLILSTDATTCIPPPICKPDEFTCKGSTSSFTPKCIPLQWRCDGGMDCEDRSDEMNCPECPGTGQFKCPDGTCIPSSRLCDDTSQCVDSSKDCQTSPKIDLTGYTRQENRSERPQTGSNLATATTSTYLIAVFASLISLLIIGLVVYYCKKHGSSGGTSGDNSVAQPLATLSQENGNGVTAIARISKGTLDGRDGGTVSAIGGSSNGLLYDRSHVTGASSSSGTSSSENYPALHHGPPPSPATSVAIRLSSLSRLVPRTGALAKNRQGRYRYYSHRAVPPCTPCSTDVADESDSMDYSALTQRPHFTSRAGSLALSRNGYDSEGPYNDQIELPSLLEMDQYAPPPSTPLYLSDYGGQESSCGGSPTTERSYFINPCLPGPPPSPVPSMTVNNSLAE